MTTPRVRELRVPLEPLSPDPFLQGLEEAAAPSDDGDSPVRPGAAPPTDRSNS